MGLKLLVAALCVLANGFFVAAEFGLVKVRVTQLMTRAKKGEARAERALAIVRRLDTYLSALQLGITLTSLALGWIGEPAVADLLRAPLRWAGVSSDAIVHAVSFTAAFALITTLHIVVGEQAPKMLAIERAESVSMSVARPVRVFFVVMYPFLWVLTWLSRVTLRALGLSKPRLAEASLSAEEIRVIVAGGQIEATKRELIERVMQGTDRPVRAVMVPRVDMVTVSLKDPADRVMAVARTNGYSRIPVMQAHDPDKVVGYLYMKDLLLGDGLPAGGVEALRRDILFVPESRKVADALRDFQRTRIPIAIVVDEYGGTSGLITVEDILEEIVGELQDELDAEPPRIVAREDGSVVVDGMVPVGELGTHGVEAEGVEAHETVAGLVVERLGRLARPGDTVRLGAFEVTVEDVRRRRVTRVRLTRRPVSVSPPGHGETHSEGDGEAIASGSAGAHGNEPARTSK
jgi:CBS domain containing-hemolysin-like protein